MARERLSVGDVVGPYHLLGERAWGQGIYRAAIDTRTYENVSLCEIVPAADTDQAGKAKRLRELRHPSLISLRDIENHDGVLFAVLDGIDGAAAPFSEAMPPSVVERVSLFVEAYAGVAALAEHGLMGLPLGTEAIVLTDAGRAFALPYDALLPADWKLGPHSAQTETIAPETIEYGALDASADVYSAAVVLFSLLTDRLPFAGATVEDRLGAKLRGDVRTLDHERNVPAGVARVVTKALSRVPGQRHSSLEVFLDDVLLATTGAKRTRIAAKCIDVSGTFIIQVAGQGTKRGYGDVPDDMMKTVMDFRPPDLLDPPEESPEKRRARRSTRMGFADEVELQAKPLVPIEGRVTEPGPSPVFEADFVEHPPPSGEVIDAAAVSGEAPMPAPTPAPNAPLTPPPGSADSDSWPEVRVSDPGEAPEDAPRLSLPDEKVETYYWLLWPLMLAGFGALAYWFLSG